MEARDKEQQVCVLRCSEVVLSEGGISGSWSRAAPSKRASLKWFHISCRKYIILSALTSYSRRSNHRVTAWALSWRWHIVARNLPRDGRSAESRSDLIPRIKAGETWSTTSSPNYWLAILPKEPEKRHIAFEDDDISGDAAFKTNNSFMPCFTRKTLLWRSFRPVSSVFMQAGRVHSYKMEHRK